ncbi:YgcG family protein [Aestuariibius sp. HNIBRBA575]|uniref:TPM domain-containing protein n=1 Tax=Aestuariibius sp. HNIBRBA575 TaxID=3233343 RepID=UPI0034A11283
MRLLSILSSLMVWAVLCGSPSISMSQTFPDHDTNTLNDFADLLTADQEAQIITDLDEIRTRTGVEFTIVTLNASEPYVGDLSIDDYSEALFNHWGVGDAAENNGLMLLIFRDDRALWYEMGAGYDAGWKPVLWDIIDNHILPEFRNGDFNAGIVAAVSATNELVITPNHGGAPAPVAPENTETSNRDGDQSGGYFLYYLGAFFAAIAGLIAWLSGANRRKYNKMTCPECKKQGMDYQKNTLSAATKTSKGEAEEVISCRHCDHVLRSIVVLPILTTASSSSGSSTSGGGFGGGTGGGGGGGAGGNW